MTPADGGRLVTAIGDSRPVAVVVPVYGNGPTLPALAARLAAALTVPWTLRLVVDACPQGSGVVAAALAAQDPRIRVSDLPHNVGQHRAIVQGLMDEPDARAWVCLDGDLQDPPEAIPLLLTALTDVGESAEGPGTQAGEGVAGVFAGRRGAYETPGRRLTGTLHRRALAALTGLPVDAGAYVAMNRSLRDAVVTGLLERGAPSVVVAAGASGLPLASVPVRRDVRTDGHTAWTSRARLRQSAATLRWAARQRWFAGRLAPHRRCAGSTASRTSLPREVVRFLLIGAGGTAAFLLAYLLLRMAIPAQPANLVGRLCVAVATTWLNARYTFSARVSPRRLFGGAIAVLAVATTISASLLAAEQALFGPADRVAEVAALAVANVVATVARFLLLRQWLFRSGRSTGDAQRTPRSGSTASGIKVHETIVTVPIPGRRPPGIPWPPSGVLSDPQPLRGET